MQVDPSPTLPPWKDPKKIGLAVFAAFIFQILILSALTAKGLFPRFASTRGRLEVTELHKTSWRHNNHFNLHFSVSKLPKDPDLVEKPLHPWMDSNSSSRWASKPEVFIHLKFLPDENLWVPIKFATKPPQEGKFIKGILKSHGDIIFGIEDFYFREGNGHLYQEALAAKRLVAEIFLAPDGSCQMKTLVILDKAHSQKDAVKNPVSNK